MTAETTEEPFVNSWHAYQCHTTHWSQGSSHRQSHGWIWTGKLPWHGICLPCQVSNVQIEAKTTKKQEKGTKKRKLDFKGMTQTTLDHWLFKPKTPTWVRFKEWVLLRVGPRCPWTGSPIHVVPLPRNACKQNVAWLINIAGADKDWPPETSKEDFTHILKRMMPENTKLGYQQFHSPQSLKEPLMVEAWHWWD